MLTDVLIVDAGPTGPMLANQLARRDIGHMGTLVEPRAIGDWFARFGVRHGSSIAATNSQRP